MKFERLAKAAKVTIVASALAVAGCATSKVALMSHGDTPAAEGIVATSRTKNQNTAVDVRVKHLAEPARIEPGATTYVVWARPAGTRSVQNLGALSVDGKLNGQLKTVTPFPQFELFITAEPTAAVSQPRGQELLSANVHDGR